MGFYTRRIKRILPAVLFVSVVIGIFGYFFYAPQKLIEASQQGLAAIFSYSNIYYYKTTDYFSPAATALPFLHTWSLSVEEQFYILYPLTLIAILKLQPKRSKAVLATLLIGSLGLGNY